MVDSVRVDDLIKNFNLEIKAGKKGISKIIESEMINSPWLELSGFFDYYDERRVILIGSKEKILLNQLDQKTIIERVKKIFEKKPPAVIFSKNVDIPLEFIELGNDYDVPILKSNQRTVPINSKIYIYLQERLAPRLSIHGVFLDINGMGTLITGKSGIGKSEVALELLKKGHQLISDDLVEIYEKEVGILVGSAPKLLKHYMEIRGIGIVNVIDMFGAGAYRDYKKVSLVVELEVWNESSNYDRIGLENKKIKIFDTEIPKVTIPVLPGRNVALLVESAAMNEKLKSMGFNSALEFTLEVNKKAMEGKKDDE